MEGGQFPDGSFAPIDVNSAGEEPVEEIVSEGDAIEHLGDLLLFTQFRVFVWNDRIVGVFCHSETKIMIA